MGPVVNMNDTDLPERPRRQMPSIRAIAAHHKLPADKCWRCGSWVTLERAHIVDRMGWEHGAGLDGPQNLALLCWFCHRLMPIIRPEDWEQGREYVGLEGKADLSQILADLGADVQ